MAELGKLIGEDAYRASVCAIYSTDGWRLVIHGTPNLELEAGLLAQTVNALYARYHEIVKLISASNDRTSN